MLLVEIADSSVARMFQKISETILGWFCFEEDHFWARPTSTKVGTELDELVDSDCSIPILITHRFKSETAQLYCGSYEFRVHCNAMQCTGKVPFFSKALRIPKNF